MTAARLSVELDLDALEVAQIAEQELQMATMAAVRELLLKVQNKLIWQHLAWQQVWLHCVCRNVPS